MIYKKRIHGDVRSNERLARALQAVKNDTNFINFILIDIQN